MTYDSSVVSDRTDRPFSVWLQRHLTLSRPQSFARFAWDYSTTLGPNGHWGRWQDGLGMTPDALALLALQ